MPRCARPGTSRIAALGVAMVLGCAAPGWGQDLVSDYPTEARAEYVFACMAINGQTQDMLHRCSCSIDQIAAILPYDAYLAAETVLRMRQGGGERAALFRGGAPAASLPLADLRRAQAEAEMLCF